MTDQHKRKKQKEIPDKYDVHPSQRKVQWISAVTFDEHENEDLNTMDSFGFRKQKLRKKER